MEKQILIINVNITGNSPQPIRIRELIRNWREKARITLITMNNFEDGELQLGENVEVVKTDYSPVGRVMISKNIIATRQYIEAKKTVKRRIREVVRKIWRASIFYRLMFPDKFIFEHRQIMGQIKKLQKAGNKYSSVIISASPFSLLKLGREIKKLFPEAKYVYDTGDPFYGNSSQDLIKPLRTSFARRFETKYLPDFDHIVVPTLALKDHYIHHFGNIIDHSAIHIIAQGYEPLFSDIKRKDRQDNRSLKLLYAGGLYRDLREPFELYKAIEAYVPQEIRLRIFGNIHAELLPVESSKCYYGGSIPSTELLNEYLACDATVFIDNRTGIQVPGKILELMGINRPILFIYDSPLSPAMALLDNFKGAVICNNNVRDILMAIKELNENYHLYNNNDISDKFTWPVLASEYLEVVL